MKDTLNKISIKIPSTIYVDSNKNNDIKSLIYIKFLIYINHNNSFYNYEEYLDLDEVKQIISYLRESINYFENPEKENILNRNHIVKPSINIIDHTQVNKEQIKSIGQLIIEQKPYIIIDIGYTSNNLGIRLIVIDNNNLCLCCWLTIEEAKKIIDGFLLSISVLNQNPPSIISNLHIGKIEAFSSNGKKYWTSIEIDDAASDDSNSPSIILDITEIQEEDGLSNTWWLENLEALKLINIFKKIPTTFHSNNSVIGFLGESESSPWLTVKIAKNPFLHNHSVSSPEQNWVCLVFDDELIRENQNNSTLWLTVNSIEKLGKLLSQALENQTNLPSSFNLPSQLEDSEIFVLNF